MKTKTLILFASGIAILFCVIIFSPLKANAEEDISTYDNSLSESFNFDIELLYPYLDDNTKQFFEDSNIDEISDIQNFDLKNLYDYLLEILGNELKSPLKTVISIAAVMMLSLFISVYSENIADEKNKNTVDGICILIMIFIIYEPLYNVFSEAKDLIESTAEFMMTFTPVFTAAAALSSGSITAGGSSMVIYAVSDVIIQFSQYIFMPLLSIVFTLAVTDAVSNVFSMQGLIESISKLISFSLKAILTVYVGILSYRTIAGSAADKLGSKTIKLILSSSIPVVGSAISEAYTSVRSSITVFRNYIGIMGIIIIVLFLLPVIVKVVLFRIITMISYSAAEFFNLKIFVRFFQNMENVVSIAFALLVSVISIFIISISIVILFFNTAGFS